MSKTVVKKLYEKVSLTPSYGNKIEILGEYIENIEVNSITNNNNSPLFDSIDSDVFHYD